MKYMNMSYLGNTDQISNLSMSSEGSTADSWTEDSRMEDSRMEDSRMEDSRMEDSRYDLVLQKKNHSQSQILSLVSDGEIDKMETRQNQENQLM